MTPVNERMTTAQGNQRVPPRLHVFLAREATVGLVVRRGPSKHTCTIRWDRETDSFTVGQWMKSRIYLQRSDLSPDGKHFLYFAISGKSEEEAWYSWTAISRVPYLRHVVAWPDCDTWGGGGLFVSNTEYWLGGDSLYPPDETLLASDLRRVSQPDIQWDATGQTCFMYFLYEERMRTSGWDQAPAPSCAPEEFAGKRVWKKEIGSGWVLLRIPHSQPGNPVPQQPASDAEWHALFHEATGVFVPHTDWEWADVDRHRLVWASGGKLFEGFVEESGVTREREIADFNDMEFTELRAPYDDRPADDDEG